MILQDRLKLLASVVGAHFACGPTTGVTTETEETGTGTSSGSSTTEPEPTGSGSGAENPDFCTVGEPVLVGEYEKVDSLQILRDEQGWRLAFRIPTWTKDTLTGAQFFRPGTTFASLDFVDGPMAVMPTSEGMLLCWDDGLTTKEKNYAFCVSTDLDIHPTTSTEHVPFRSVRALINFPDVRLAVAREGLWPIDEHGIPQGEVLGSDVWSLAFGKDWFLGARFEDPFCPNPEENALCVLEFAPFNTQGQLLAPFLPLSATTLAPNEQFRAGIAGDRYLLAWTAGGPWDLRLVTQENQLLSSTTLDTLTSVFGGPNGFALLVPAGNDAENASPALWPLDLSGTALADPLTVATIPAGERLSDFALLMTDDGMAAAWMTSQGLLAEHRERVYFRELGCEWPPMF